MLSRLRTRMMPDRHCGGLGCSQTVTAADLDAVRPSRRRTRMRSDRHGGRHGCGQTVTMAETDAVRPSRRKPRMRTASHGGGLGCGQTVRSDRHGGGVGRTRMQSHKQLASISKDRKGSCETATRIGKCHTLVLEQVPSNCLRCS